MILCVERAARFARLQFARALAPVLAILPAKLSFAVIVLCRRANLPGRTVLTRAFLLKVAAVRRHNPDYRFSSEITRRFAAESAAVLFELRAFAEVVELLGSSAIVLASSASALILHRSYFELGQLENASETLAPWSSDSRRGNDPVLTEMLALSCVLNQDPDKAAVLMKEAAADMTHLMRPHQNMAAYHFDKYLPTSLDIAAGANAYLFDIYNFMGQRVTHVGEGERCVSMYAGALRTQHILHDELMAARAHPSNARRPSKPISERTRTFLRQHGKREDLQRISPALESLLLKLNIPVKDLKVLPSEWVTQIGHLGMIDILMRMRTLDWWKGRAVILAPPMATANKTFLSLYEDQAEILVPKVNVSANLFAELISLQRYCGMNFNAFEMPSGEVVPWQDAGAQAMQAWDAAGRAPPLIARYDAAYGNLPAMRTLINSIKQKWGMKPDDWYVCLHMRDASHYKETEGTGQSHRNAGINSYIAAIRDITDRGGWVIKLGGRGSPKLPDMPRLIDYARSEDKSELLDLDLIRHARFFIGTTSGLTNVAVSFGKHCALVNCITTDAQLWSDRVRFALKPVRLKDGTMIRQGPLTVAPWRWRMFSAESLANHGAVSYENSSDEVLEICREVEALALGDGDRYTATIPDAAQLTSQWKQSLEAPHFYGNARPSLYYLKAHRDEFLAQAS